jgi:Tol biopolymer transport system component
VNVGDNVNSDGNEFYPSLTETGILYFTATYEGSEDIFKSEMIDGKYAKPERLAETINSGHGEFNALIAPDESFLIFSSYGREDDLGGSDMYISFKRSDGSWTQAKNLGAPLNSKRIDYCPALSPDGRYFFFTSGRISEELADWALATYNDITTIESSPRNGNDDIYWVKSSVLRQFK